MRLKDAEARLFKREILFIGAIDQRIEFRVFEDLPPKAEGLRVLVLLDIGFVDPVFGDRRLGRTIIGANLKTIMKIVV